MHFTSQDTLMLLRKSKRKGWTLRQMTTLREEGYLPPLMRLAQPGTNRPHYVWNESDLEQICEVYDCWEQYGGDRASLTLDLWLQGYDVLLDPLRRMYCQMIDTYLQRLTHGETDPDDILFEASHVALAVIRKFKYTPGLTDQRKKFNMEEMEQIIENIFGALAVPSSEMADEMARSFLRAAGLAEGEFDLEEAMITPNLIITMLRDILALPNLREMVQEATREQWEQAREDYLIFCQRMGEMGKGGGVPELPPCLRWHLIMQGACWLIVPLLSTRYRGHGRWIDVAFEKMHQAFTDPSIQAKVRKGMRERKRRKAKNRNGDYTEAPG